MIWTIVEYVAIITECLIATRLFLLYFKLKSDDWKYLKSIILFAPLFITDVIGSFGAANEVFFYIDLCIVRIYICSYFSARQHHGKTDDIYRKLCTSLLHKSSGYSTYECIVRRID